MAVWVSYHNNLIIRLKTKESMQQKTFFNGLQEPRLVAFQQSELRSSDVFWDVGTNIGVMILVVSRHCDSVISFDPDSNCSALEQLRTD